MDYLHELSIKNDTIDMCQWMNSRNSGLDLSYLIYDYPAIVYGRLSRAVLGCFSFSLLFIYYYNLSMPPKKDNKKQAQAKPDHSGIPKLDIEFKFSFNIKAEGQEPPNYALMFEWFGNISDKFERHETATLDGWKKDQNNYSFEKQADIIRVDDDFCKNICNKQFYVYFVNADDNKVEDQILLDYSSLLTASDQPKFVFESNIIKVIGIQYFSVTLTADKALITETYRHYLNPLEVQIIGAKDLPVEKSSKYQPVYIKYIFFDGSIAQTHPLVGSDKLMWSHKHVFLVGFMNATDLKEKMRSRYIKFQLHDRDQINNKKIKPDVEIFDITKAIQEEIQKEKPIQEDPKKKGAKKEDKKQVKKEVKKDPKKKEAKLGQPILLQKPEVINNNFGVSACSLVEFLKPTTKSARYKVPIVPKNTFEDFQSKNIDLNTTARNQMQKIISSNNYFDCDSVLVVGFNLAFAIGTFVKPEIKDEPVVDDKKKKDAKQVKQVAVDKKQQGLKELKKDVFERVVYVVPYKNAELVKKIQDIFYSINLKAFKLKNRRQINTHLLSKPDQQSITIDYVTGIEIADPEGRIYIIEGLKEGSIKEFHQHIIKSTPNTKDHKIFKNSNILFSHRLFASFHIEIKRIRLRPSLSTLLLQPSIYIKSKVAEEICQNLNRLHEIRKVCDDLTSVDSMNLWPNAEWLVQIQRKFSQSLSHEDIFGQQSKKQKRELNETGQVHKTITLLQNTQFKVVTSDDFFLPKINTGDNEATYPDINLNSTGKRTVMTKTFTKDAAKHIPPYQMRGKSIDNTTNEPVYIYGGQKNNFYEKKMRQLREQMRQNPNLIYTYDKDYFRLAIDPNAVDQEKRKDKELSMSKMFSKDKFTNVLVRTKDQRLRLPNRLQQEDANDILNHPYHEQKLREKEIQKNYRDLPPTNGKQDFKKYLRSEDVFSHYIPIEGQNLSLVQKQRIWREEKHKHHQEELKKLKGDPHIKIKKGYLGEHSYGVDRFKDIRQGQAQKLGIIDYSKRLKEKRVINAPEVSYNLKQTPVDPSFNPLVRIDQPKLNIQQDEFNFYQTPEVLTRTAVYKPLKDIL